MIHSYSVQTKNCLQKHSRTFNFVKLTIFICTLIVVTGTNIACVDFSVDLKIENRMPIDVKMVYSQHYNDGSSNFNSASDIIPAGKDGKVRTGIINGISAVPKIILQAEDSSGKVVWQKTWTGEEFGKLENAGWKIVVSPETSS